MKLIPLQQWVCDQCGEIIKTPKDGWLEWLHSTTQDVPAHGFRIVHHKMASPIGSCYYRDHRDVNPVHVSDNHLNYYLETDGLAKLLAFYRPYYNASDPLEVAEIIKRLHLPHYEEARLYWQQAYHDGYTDTPPEHASCAQESMLRIIGEYSDKD